jgi:putative transposase
VLLLQAHLVFVTKYRRPIFTGDILTSCEDIMRTMCAELDAELAEFNGEANHVHVLVVYPPTLAMPTLVQRLKGRMAYAVRREYTGHCVRTRMHGHLWSPSYFAVSCTDGPLSIIKQHIDGQARPL